jgi:predicted acylesterase/phospholipase RssA
MGTPEMIGAEPEVISALKQRAADPASRPHARCDTCRIAFVAGSGAMAAAITGGMVAALQANGITARCFDLFIGTSAGAVAAAYYAADRAIEGALIPSRTLSSSGYGNNGTGPFYISVVRALTGGYLLDLDGFVDNFIDLDLTDVKVPVVALACTRQGELRELILSGADVSKIRRYLKASMRVPYLAPGDVNDPDTLWDGAYVNVLPVDIAHKHQATHALVVACFPPEIDSKLDLIERRILAPIAQLKGHAEIRELLLGKRSSNSRARADAAPIQAMAYIHELPDARLGPGTTNPTKLWQHTVRAYHHTVERFSLPQKKLPVLWQNQAA